MLGSVIFQSPLIQRFLSVFTESSSVTHISLFLYGMVGVFVEVASCEAAIGFPQDIGAGTWSCEDLPEKVPNERPDEPHCFIIPISL